MLLIQSFCDGISPSIIAACTSWVRCLLRKADKQAGRPITFQRTIADLVAYVNVQASKLSKQLGISTEVIIQPELLKLVLFEDA